MKTLLALIIATLLSTWAVAGQTPEGKPPQKPMPRPASPKPAPKTTNSRLPSPPPRKAAAVPTPATSPVLGAAVIVVTKNGDKVAGALVDLSAFSIKIKSDGLETAFSLDTISSISFGELIENGLAAQPAGTSAGADFAKDLESIIRTFQSMASGARAGADYTDYGHQLSELRQQTERFIARYGSAENGRAARAVALLASALTDYSWARTIWTLKSGRTRDGTVAEDDSPVVADLLTLYPDLRQEAAMGSRFAAEKLITGLWKKAAEKVDQARLVNQG